MESESTDVEIRLMYNSVKKNKLTWRYIGALALHTSAPTVHWEYNTIFIYVVDARTFTRRFKQIYIPFLFLREIFDNGLFVQKYDKSSVVPEDMCTKPCSGPIISRGNKCMAWLRIYPTGGTENYQLMR